MKKFILILFAIFATNTYAVNLTSIIDHGTSGSTAASAKQSANNAAIRAAASEVLGRYADRGLVSEALDNTEDARLLNMVTSTSISNERASRTAYSARFTISFSRSAMEKWYGENNIADFLGAADDSGNRSLVVIEVKDLREWAALRQAMRSASTDFNLRINSIFRNSATAYVNARERYKFQTLARSNGWNASASDGVLRISK